MRSEQLQANEQIALLERGTSSTGSDFYTYRYLATEGFLPGYNFPRLPLYAYVPAGGGGASKATYLQRARFLAIAEFGPRSLIYHEGRAYRVTKAKLPPGRQLGRRRKTSDRNPLCLRSMRRGAQIRSGTLRRLARQVWQGFIRFGIFFESTMSKLSLPCGLPPMMRIVSGRDSKSRPSFLGRRVRGR